MKIKKIAIVTRDALNTEILEPIEKLFSEYGVSTEHKNVNDIEDDGFYKNADLILTAGGDGTLLAAARKASIYDKPVIGVNMGHLGFLTAIEVDQIEMLRQLFSGEYTIDERMMLECEYPTDEGTEKSYCLNDIIISRGMYPRMIKPQIRISGQLAEEYTADGIIVSTPTGSTAYSLSAGGPIVFPDLDVMTITPICPHSLNNRSLIVGGKEEVTIECNMSYNPAFLVSCDGSEAKEITDKVVIRKSRYITRLVRLKEDGFYSILRKKMSERSVK